MLSKARGCNALATSLEMQQIRDAPLVMHQDHSESLGLHVAQRINCYKLPRKLPQIRSAQQCLSGIRGRGKRRASQPRMRLNIIYIMRNGIRRFGQRWSSFVGSAWQWLGLWLGSCLRPETPAKDEIAA